MKGQARHLFAVKFWATPGEDLLYSFSFLQTAEPAAAQTSDSQNYLLMIFEILENKKKTRVKIQIHTENKRNEIMCHHLSYLSSDSSH